MSDHAWVSAMINDVRLVVMFLSDIVERNEALAIRGIRAMKAGQPVPREQCPTTVWPEKGYTKIRDDQTPPPLFNANGYWIVSGEVAAILNRFDLGGGALYPVKVLKSDRRTRFDGDWWCWIFGNTKDAFLDDASRNLRSMAPIPGIRTRKLAIAPADGDVALSAEALAGPEVWIEPELWSAVLLSGPLGDALAEARLTKAFRLTKARIITADGEVARQSPAVTEVPPRRFFV